MFERVAFIGIGLIGSSLARVIRRQGLAKQVIACARAEATRAKALELGIVDEATAAPEIAVRDADLVVLATPLGAYPKVSAAIAPELGMGSIVTDVGSVKAAAIRDVAPFMPEGVHFVPGHPVAGTEHSGPEAGFETLFEGRWCILTPPAECDQAAVDRVAELWRRSGSMIEIMTPERHDKILGITSHLPHLIAYTIVGTVADLEDSTQSEVVKYAAGGFREFTRIAASDPVMWRDIFVNNQDAVLEMLSRFSEDLARMQRAIRWGEADTLEKLFRRTREVRRGVIEARQT